MTASLALAAGLLAYTAASSAFVGYRLGPMVKSWARPPGRAFVLRTKLLRILASGFNLSRKN
ncbi:hypothetical protein SR39_13625 [Methylobacterium radiotolerans]|jgi:hypothetical protein|nr:hypothetical protein SR39_13625 [Methylobacterium radiotolerans]